MHIENKEERTLGLGEEFRNISRVGRDGGQSCINAEDAQECKNDIAPEARFQLTCSISVRNIKHDLDLLNNEALKPERDDMRRNWI
jgi:hypothetical protein